jgi:hypothetical protein
MNQNGQTNPEFVSFETTAQPTDVVADVPVLTDIVEPHELFEAQPESSETPDEQAPISGLVDPQKVRQKKQAPRPTYARSSSAFEALSELRDRLIPPTVDGETCINTHHRDAKTVLGKAMAIEALAPFDHPELGRFSSVAAMSLFITVPDPEPNIRTLHDNKPFAYIRNNGCRQTFFDTYDMIMADALWIKVNTQPGLKELLLGNDLPIRHYYLNHGDTPVDTRESRWIVPAYSEIIRVLKNNQRSGEDNAPDFSFLAKKRENWSERNQGRNARR